MLIAVLTETVKELVQEELCGIAGISFYKELQENQVS